MLRNFGVALSFGALVFEAGCVFDATGSQPEGTTSSGHGGATTVSTVGPGPGPTSTSTTTTTTGGGGAGGGAVCGDGIIEAPETCETGDITFPSCVDCMIPNHCGNNVIDPGEACDESSGNCMNCKVTAGSCFGVEKLPLTLVPTTASSNSTLMIPGSFDDVASPNACGTAGPRDVKVYEFDVGPYPSGLYVAASGDAGGVGDAAIWVYNGCKKTPTLCDDVDPDPLATTGNPAFIALPVQAPGSVVYVAVGDHAGGMGNFDFIAAPTRLFADFENTAESFTAGAGWTVGAHSMNVLNPAAPTTLESPDVDVVGITNLSIAFSELLTTGANATIVVVPDVGPSLAPVAVPDTTGTLKGRGVTVPIPAGTKSVKVRFILAPGNSPDWELHRVIIGPVPS